MLVAFSLISLLLHFSWLPFFPTCSSYPFGLPSSPLRCLHFPSFVWFLFCILLLAPSPRHSWLLLADMRDLGNWNPACFLLLLSSFPLLPPPLLFFLFHSCPESAALTTDAGCHEGLGEINSSKYPFPCSRYAHCFPCFSYLLSLPVPAFLTLPAFPTSYFAQTLLHFLLSCSSRRFFFFLPSLCPRFHPTSRYDPFSFSPLKIMTANPFFGFAQRRREREEEFGYDNPEEATATISNNNSNNHHNYIHTYVRTFIHLSIHTFIHA